MNTEEKFGLKKQTALLLFLQMVLTVFILAVAVYLLIFVIANNLGGWMITSYIFITISVLAVACYSFIGYKKGEIAYFAAIIPYLVAIFVNILLPNRDTFQVGVLSVLFALASVFLASIKNKKLTRYISIAMVLVSLTFSIYSSVTANTQFLGEISSAWPTYVAMYSSIFVPTIMSGTFALISYVRSLKD